MTVSSQVGNRKLFYSLSVKDGYYILLHFELTDNQADHYNTFSGQIFHAPS